MSHSLIKLWIHAIFGTKDIVIGVPGYYKPGDSNFGNLLLLPFKKQRDYWKKPDGSVLISREKYISENPGKLED